MGHIFLTKVMGPIDPSNSFLRFYVTWNVDKIHRLPPAATEMAELCLQVHKVLATGETAAGFCCTIQYCTRHNMKLARTM